VVQKGNLIGAEVYADNNQNGLFDAGDGAKVVTDSNGGYTLTDYVGTYNVVAITNANTVDDSTGATIGAGVKLEAPAGASMVTPSTTMVTKIMTANGVDATTAAGQVATALGFTAADVALGFDPLTFNAYEAGVDATLALKAEKTAQKIMAVVNTFAAAAEGTGASQADAFASAMSTVAKVLEVRVDKAVAGTGTAADQQLNFDNAADMTAITTQMVTDMTTVTGVDVTSFTNMATKTKDAIENVIAVVEAVASIDATADAFATVKLLQSDVTTQLAATKAAGGVAQDLKYDDDGDTTLLATAVANKAPTAITAKGADAAELTTISISEASTTKVVIASMSTTDATSGDTHTYTIEAGLNGALFDINASTGALSYKANPDYETMGTDKFHQVAVTSTDAGGKSVTKTFKINVVNAAESGDFGINSDIISFTDYDPAGSGTDITNTLLTATSGTSVGIGTGAVQVNLTNMTNHVNSSFVGTTKSPTLKFTLDSVPTGSGISTVKVMITDGNDMTRTGAEDQIGIEVDVHYNGTDGETATLTVPAQEASGTFTSDGSTAVGFKISNLDADAFSITKAVESDPSSQATFDIKLGTLYDAFVNGAGKSELLLAGTYNVAIETTLPMLNAADETVTKFMANVELVASSAATRKDTLTGTDGADTLTGGSTGQIVDAGMGKDTIALGSGADFVVLAAGDGNAASASANTVTNFADGTDKFLLEGGLTFSDLTIAEGATTADTTISITAVAAYGSTAAVAEEFLMHVTGVSDDLITAFDFVTEIA
jgi:hypothetical protein